MVSKKSPTKIEKFKKSIVIPNTKPEDEGVTYPTAKYDRTKCSKVKDLLAEFPEEVADAMLKTNVQAFQKLRTWRRKLNEAVK